MPVSSPDSDADFARARRAVERGWVTKEQLEAAVLERDRNPESRLLAHFLKYQELDPSRGSAADRWIKICREALGKR